MRCVSMLRYIDGCESLCWSVWTCLWNNNSRNYDTGSSGDYKLKYKTLHPPNPAPQKFSGYSPEMPSFFYPEAMFVLNLQVLW